MRSLRPILFVLALTSPTAAQLDLQAWHARGQTWLVWENDQTFSGSESWSVYRSASPIVDLASAELVAKTYPEDARGNRLFNAAPGATWIVPDPTGVGTYALASTEALFVYTPRVAAPEYFAVVKTGDIALSIKNTVGPVVQTVDPAAPHPQVVGFDGGHPFILYSVWIDGDLDETAGRSDFPVLGPASFRGQARLFCAFEPISGLPPAPIPAVVFLHGGSGNYWNYRPSKSSDQKIDLGLGSGLYVTFDDRTYIRTSSTGADGLLDIRSQWFGFSRSFDRFEPVDTLPPPGEIAVDYTQRWIDWVLDWLVADRDVDVHRIAMMGFSMGGRGTSVYARLRPERVSAATVFAMSGDFTADPSAGALWGGQPMGLPTPFGGLTVSELFEPTTLVSGIDLPFLRYVDGTNDTQSVWDPKPAIQQMIEADRWGAAWAWDEREHTSSNGGWDTAHFVGSPRHGVDWLTRYRNDQSFPAFHGIDHAIGVPGDQPDPGDAVVPANGDPWGKRGGWLDWMPDSIVDRPRRWSVSLALVASSSFAPDNAPQPTAQASVTIRRAQRFRPAPGTVVNWTFRRIGDGALLATGATAVDANGLVTVPDLIFGSGPMRLEVVEPVPQATWAKK